MGGEALHHRDWILFENDEYSINRARSHWLDGEQFENRLRDAQQATATPAQTARATRPVLGAVMAAEKNLPWGGQMSKPLGRLLLIGGVAILIFDAAERAITTAALCRPIKRPPI